MLNKRIMILGAGPFQVPAIKKAVSLSLHVITVDYLPNNIGHRYSHEYVNCSTTDRDGVLQAAIQKNISGICTFSSDAAIPTVGYVTENIGLPGPSLAVAETMAYKHRFRAFLQAKGLSCPSFAIARSAEDAWKNANRLKFPILAKPVDTSGSRGISKVSSCDSPAVTNAFAHAINFSPLGVVCLEEFIEGIEVGGDGFLCNGKFSFIAITHKHMRGFIVVGHSIPASISPFDQNRVRIALEDCCNAVGYNNGPLNFDVMVTTDEVFILEMSARNGGNGIPSVIDRATGVDLERMTIKYAVGEDVEPPLLNQKSNTAGSFIFGSEIEGILQHISNFDTVQVEVPELFGLFLAIHPGDKVSSFTHNGNLIGYALFDFLKPDSYDSVSQRILESLKIEVSERKPR